MTLQELMNKRAATNRKVFHRVTFQRAPEATSEVAIAAEILDYSWTHVAQMLEKQGFLVTVVRGASGTRHERTVYQTG